MPDSDLNGVSQDPIQNENEMTGTDFPSDNGEVVLNNDEIVVPSIDNSQEIGNEQLANEGSVNEGLIEQPGNNPDLGTILNNLASLDPIDSGNSNTFQSDIFDSVSFESENLGSMSDENQNNSDRQQGENIDLNNNLGATNSENSIYDNEPDEIQNFNKYLSWFFIATAIIILSIVYIGGLFSFEVYITHASQITIEEKYQSYVSSYKEKLHKIKSLFGLDHSSEYVSPDYSRESFKSDVSNIIAADNIDYIEKKDLLTPSVSNLVHNTQDDVSKIYSIKQEIAKQGFLPEEIRNILGDEQAIDTIQRSLNALEIIKFSTASKVFSYLDTALTNITDMVRMNGVREKDIEDLLNIINSRGEKDISAYVYLCYLNPYEIDTSCNTVGDLDLYYQFIKDDTINLKLFKNVMSALNQLLENDDTSLFSITFNKFNAQDKEITFDIEVFTNQNDERALINKGQKNPTIFILKNIINLLKQSRFIIGTQVDTKEIEVESRTITYGDVSSIMKYSSKSFTVPIQKDSEREIFDYIDLENIQKLINKIKNKSDVNEDVEGNETQLADLSDVSVENVNDSEQENSEDGSENIESGNEGESMDEGKIDNESIGNNIIAENEDINYEKEENSNDEDLNQRKEDTESSDSIDLNKDDALQDNDIID